MPVRQNEHHPHQKVAPYERYAAVYDEIGQREFGERIAEATLQYLTETHRTPHSVIDLACGTGAATLVFAAAGMSVLGIDRSPAMLAQARASFTSAGLHGTFVERDLRDPATEPPADLVTCFYDSLNYLISTDELRHVFQQVRLLLAPGGLLVFDVNTREKFNSTWNNSCFVAVDRDDLFGIYQSWYEPESGISPLLLTFFVRESDGTWCRFDEEHVERAYELSELVDMLVSAGLDIEAMLSYRDRSPVFGSTASERSHRVVFIARPVLEGRGTVDQ